MTRREFVTGVLAAGVAAHVRVDASPLGLPIGSQTYPHRQMISAGDFAGLLKTLKEMGVETVELCSAFGYKEFAPLADAAAVKKTLADHGMKCESAHFSMRELRENQQKSIDWAREIGMTQMVVATLGGSRTPTLDEVKKAADEYNTIAGVAAKAGMQQTLHNEGFESSSVDGRRTYDILIEDLLDPKLVKYQFQMSTINQGLVAADYFTKYPGRFISMHIQDVDMTAPVTGGGRGRGQVAVGKGSIDWAKTFTAARIGGVKNYFVEQNMDLTKASVAALKAMNVS